MKMGYPDEDEFYPVMDGINKLVDEWEDEYLNESEQPEAFKVFFNRLMLFCKSQDERDILKKAKVVMLQGWNETYV